MGETGRLAVYYFFYSSTSQPLTLALRALAASRLLSESRGGVMSTGVNFSSC